MRKTHLGSYFMEANIGSYTKAISDEGPQEGKPITLLYSKEKQISSCNAVSLQGDIFARVIRNRSAFQQQAANK